MIELGCEVGELSSTYLGLPLGVPFILVSVLRWGEREVS